MSHRFLDADAWVSGLVSSDVYPNETKPWNVVIVYHCIDQSDILIYWYIDIIL